MTTFTVSSASTLSTALSKATGGDTIVLKAGSYGDVSIYNRNFSSEVTIVSEAPFAADLASLTINKSSNITFNGIDVEYVAKDGDKVATPAIFVNNSAAIGIVNSEISGTLVKGFGHSSADITTPAANGVIGVIEDHYTGLGIRIANSSDITVSGNDISNLWGGMNVGTSNGVTITGNEIHNNRSEGVQLLQSSNVLIDGNIFRDFSPWYAANPTIGDHPDFIQMWTTGTTADSNNITISNNYMFTGEGGWTQSIFYHYDSSNPYGFNNVEISNNFIYNGHVNAIYAGDITNGLNVFENLLLAATASNNIVDIPRILETVQVTDSDIANNVSAGVNLTKGAGPITGTAAGKTLAAEEATDNFTTGYKGILDQAFTHVDGTSKAGEAATIDLSKSQQAAYVLAGDGHDIVRGSAYDDVLMGGDGNDALYGNNGNDVLFGGLTGSDSLYGGSGDDVLVLLSSSTKGVSTTTNLASGGAGNDYLFGGAGNDFLDGGAGNDVLMGGAGNDRIWGGVGNDLLIGGAGNDELQGGDGSDTLVGGAGRDIFRYDKVSEFATGIDIIKDFEIGKGNDLLRVYDKSVNDNLFLATTNGTDLELAFRATTTDAYKTFAIIEGINTSAEVTTFLQYNLSVG